MLHPDHTNLNLSMRNDNYLQSKLGLYSTNQQ